MTGCGVEGKGVARGSVDTAESPEHGVVWRENSCGWKHKFDRCGRRRKLNVWNVKTSCEGAVYTFSALLRLSSPFIFHDEVHPAGTRRRVWNTRCFAARSNMVVSFIAVVLCTGCSTGNNTVTFNFQLVAAWFCLARLFIRTRDINSVRFE